MNDLITIEKPELPTKWDYDESVSKVKQSIYKWKNLTEELAQELWIAREMLKAPGTRTDLTSELKFRGWSQYCKEIGSSGQVVNRWLANWFSIGEKEKEKIPLLEGVFLYDLWQLKPRRTKGYGDGNYHGSTPVEVCIHTLIAYCPKDGIAYDSMGGSGTFKDVADELKIKCDMSDLKMGIDACETNKPNNYYDLVFNHFPYWNMVKYSDIEQDLSNAKTKEKFLKCVEEVFRENYRILKTGGFYCVMIGDRREDRQTIWLTIEFPRIAKKIGFGTYDNAYISTLNTEHLSTGLAEYRAKKFNYMKPSVDWYLVFKKG